LYSLSSNVVTNYDTRTLTGIVASQCDGRGVVVLEYPSNGIQNGGNDGMALIDPSGAVIEFLSYEGVLTATFGTTNVTSTDIGASQTSAAIGTSLQRNATTGAWASAASNFYGCNGRTAGRALTGFAFSGRSPTDDPPLPVGFEAQIFATARQGTTVVPHVWSSDTPNIATIDADGVITAKAAGTAVFRATTTDGLSTATYSLPMIVGEASATAQYAGNAAFGEPTDGNPADDFIIRRTEYTSSFNTTRNTPNWVAYNLDASHTATGADRCDCFTYDPELPQNKRYTTNEFTGVGSVYNRGHLVRSSDRTTGTLDNARTYYFSNVIPQAADNNQGPWAAFETYLGDLARTANKEVYIIAGVAGNIGTLKNEGDVVIPENVWKVAVIMPRNQGLANLTSLASAEVIAVIMPNVNGIRGVPWQTYKTTVDAVEALSGYNLLALIRDDLEIAIESNTRFPDAVTNGPFTEVAGTSIPMSAAGSTDPDGDALVFAWSFGDGGVASGANVTHTYVNPGAFTVRLIATDTRGLADTVFTTANVLSAVAALERAMDLLDQLEANGTLSKGQANSLGAKLKKALKQAERGKEQPVSGMLGAFLNALDAMVKTERVSEASVAGLRSLVMRALVALQL
jgi:DNA/RNA endonuclease G (NUC1)